VVTLAAGDAVAVELVGAIRAGVLSVVERLLAGHPGLATARILDSGGCSRTPLHVVADWPGHFPRGPELVAAALLDAGADIEAPGASIAGGSPLDDAVGYGCWQVARLLVERGARVDRLWQAAALGLMPRVTALLAGDPAPTAEEITEAFWQACHGGQRRMAEHLLTTQGADVNGRPGYAGEAPPPPRLLWSQVATKQDRLRRTGYSTSFSSTRLRFQARRGSWGWHRAVARLRVHTSPGPLSADSSADHGSVAHPVRRRRPRPPADRAIPHS